MKTKLMLIGILALFFAENSHSAAREAIREGGKIVRRIIMTGGRPIINQHKAPAKMLKNPFISPEYMPVGDGERLVKATKIKPKS